MPSGREVEIGARLTINPTGAALDRLLAPLGIATCLPLLKAMNLVTRRDGGEAALGGRALFGSWESAAACDPDAT